MHNERDKEHVRLRAMHVAPLRTLSAGLRVHVHGQRSYDQPVNVVYGRLTVLMHGQSECLWRCENAILPLSGGCGMPFGSFVCRSRQSRVYTARV